ncbi:MAG: DegT/DnrJ/EryC1/StrS family aminotransferase, partial [Paracoccus sp. (in: a-proteobacteria)]
NVIATPVVPDDCLSVWAQYTLKAEDGGQRDRLMAALKDAGIPSVVYYPRPLHTQTAYAGFLADPAGLPVAESLAARVLSLPMHPYLAEAEQDRVIATITKELRQ